MIFQQQRKANSAKQIISSFRTLCCLRAERGPEQKFLFEILRNTNKYLEVSIHFASVNGLFTVMSETAICYEA